jgi:hypothetical protein
VDPFTDLLLTEVFVRNVETSRSRPRRQFRVSKP